jgi:hypothetical protein
VMISLPVIVILISRRFPVASALQTVDNNPDKFYLYATGKVFSYGFTYDPHEADAWLFRTAEGHLEGSNHTPNTAPRPTATAP